MTKYPRYFLQTKSWGEFWLKSNPKNHKLIEISIENETHFIYEYPWQLGQKFWYIPRANLGKTYTSNLQKIITKARGQKVVFVKMDFDDEWLEQNKIENNSKLLDLLKKLPVQPKLSHKKLQFNQTPVLSLEGILKADSEKINVEIEDPQALQNFYQNTQDFWSQTNQNVRRYTKKSLTKNWQISTQKTEQNFQNFLQIYNQTKERQGFAIQTKSYLKNLFKHLDSRLILLSNSAGQPQAFWFGWVSENTLTYLYGGNTPESFKNYGQYLLHLVAVAMGYQENLNFYDLGGYDSKSGYGKFKENYRGQIRNFLGPVDLVLKTSKYQLINLIIKAVKFLKR